MSLTARERLILALDLPTLGEAEAMIERTRGAVGVYKVGYQLAFVGGLGLAERLARAGEPVFVDMKLHDIGHTVANGVSSVAGMGARFLTVHGYPQTMKAAVKARGSSDLKILAVTVLTSYDDSDLADAGYARTVAALAADRARQARDLGVDGLICSPEEAERLRAIVGPDMLVVTPGIRPAGSAVGDQKRIMTPAKAIAAGADYLVVGRPIVQAADPRAAADAIVAEIESAAR